MARDNVKIPAKHYVGMVKRDTEKLPLGFITPWGDDAAAVKRMATVDQWSKQGYRSTALEPLVIDNVPMSGFKMTTDIRSSSYGGVDKWRIEDPRGFELEITSGNLAELLSVGMIDRCEIMDECVWARSGQSNVLLSTATEAYKEAVVNTAVANQKADWKDAKPGNTVLLQNNVKGVWLGRMHQLVRKSSHEQPGAVGHDEVGSSDKSMHVIFIDNVTATYGGYTSELHLIASPKLSAIVDTTEITEADAELYANNRLSNPKCHVIQTGYADVMALTFGSTKPTKNYQFELVPVTIESEAELKTTLSNRRDLPATFINSDKGLYKLHEGYRHGSPNLTVAAQYDQTSFAANELRARCELKSNSNYYRHSTSNQQITRDYVWSPYDTYYNLSIKITTRNGNVINCLAH